MKPIISQKSYFHSRQGFTLIEIIFAVVLLAFFIYFITNSFVTTKKQHTMNSEYTTKAYVADIVIKLLKERMEVNPNFIAGINSLVIARNQKDKSRNCLVNPMSGNIKYKNLFDKNDYLVNIKGIPAISYSDSEKKEGFYFGIVEFKPESNLFSGDENGFKTFLNVDELAKYSYDLKIDNDHDASPVGIVKNIEVSVIYDGREETDKTPFILATKIICPISSLPSAVYQKIQKNLFSEIAQDIYENISIEMARDGFSLSALITGIERDCKASQFSAMKIINLSMPESQPDRPKADDIFKNILVLHCALELYQQAITDIDAELAKVAGQNDVISIVKVMDNSVQKAQWALQIFEAIIDPLENILTYLKPGVIVPPNPDSIFNYQVPILAMRYLLSASENDNNTTRLARFIQVAEKLPDDYSQSLEQAFTRVNDLLKSNYKKFTARQIQKYSKDLLSFQQLVWINSSRLHVVSGQINSDECSRQASATLNLLNEFYRNNNYLAGVEFIECESYKMQQINSLAPARFAEILKKIERFNTLGKKLEKLKSEVNKVDVIARGEEAVKLESAPYVVNMEELSRVYITRGRQAVQEYLENCQRVYEASLMRY